MVLVRARPLIILSSQGQRSRSQGSLKKKKKWFPLIVWRTIYHRDFIFYLLISLGEDMAPIDSGFTRSKVKVTRVLFVKQWFLLIILKNIYHRAIIFHILIGLGDVMTPYNFGFTRLKVKVTRVTFVK